MNKLSEAELWSLYQSDPRQLAEKARAAGWTQSAEDQTVWKNICTKRWSTKLPSDKIDQSNWLIPLTDNKEVDWRRYYILRDLYTALEQDIWTVMEKQNARKAKSSSGRGGRGGRGRGGKARGGKSVEAPKPVNKTETEMNPKNAGTMLETIHAAMIDITSGKAAPANLDKFLQNFADFSLDFLKVLVSQGNVNENPEIEKNNQKFVAGVFVIWEDLIGEPEAKVVNFFTNYNDKYIVNLSELLAICLKNNKRSKMIVHLLLDNVVNVWESLAQFAVAQMMGADFGDEEDEEDEEDEDDDEPTPAKAKAHGHEHEHGENCNHDHDIDDVSPVSDESLHLMLKNMQDLLINWPTEEWNADPNKVGDVDAPRPNQEFTEYVDKLSMVVGGPSIFNTVMKLVDQPLTDANADFKAKHAALFMLAVTCEASVAVYKTNDILMDKVIKTYIMPQLSHAHPDVVHAAVHTLSLMMNDLGPELQNKYHATILPALEAFLYDNTKKRNQLIAVASLTNFCEKVEDAELLTPYLKKLFEGVLPLINSEDKHIRERAFYTAAALAEVSGTHFLPYRETTLQAISKLLNTQDNEELGQVLETLCRIASFEVDEESKKVVKAALDVAVKKFEAIRKEVEAKQPSKPATGGAFNFGTATTTAPTFNFGAPTGAVPTFNFGTAATQPAQPAGDKPFVFNFSDLPSLEETADKKDRSPEDWLKTVCVLTAGLAAKVLGQDFAPYLDVYMKTLVSIIENVEDVPDDDVDPFGEDDDDDDMGGMKSAGQGPMGINPAAMNQTLFLQLNNKAKAVKTLGVFAEHLGPLFAPHVGVAVEKACAMLNYAYLEKVREKAATSLVSLYKAATGSDKDKSKLFSDIVHELISSVSEDPSLETIDAKLEALAALVSAGQLNAGQVNKLFELMSTVLEIVDQVAAESDENGEEMMDDEDDDDDEGPSGALEEADVVVGDLISLVEAIAKNNKDLFIKAFTPNLWVYQRMVEIAGLVKKKGAKTAVPAFKDKFGPWFMCCMVDAIAENIGEESFALLEKFLPIVTKYIQADESDVAQAAAFGVGVYAQAYKAKYAPFVKDALKGLKELIHGEKSEDEEFGPVIDNAISSLGKLCLYTPEAVEFTKLVDEFMKLLPITKDHEEAAICHGVLLELVAKHADLDRVQLLRIFAGLLRDDQLTNEATRKAMESKLNEWKANADSLKADIAKLDQQAQEALNKHFGF
jgi:hypothetical protein